MKKGYTREEIVNTLMAIDVRTKKLDDVEMDNIINLAYAELSTVARLFTDEVVISASTYYSASELIFSIDIEEDVVYIYDLYLTVEDSDPFLFDHGIKKITNINNIYRDNREVGKFHVNLDRVIDEYGETVIADNIIAKYFYTPSATDDTVYMDKPTFLAFRNSLDASVSDVFKDVERNNQKLAAMKRTGLSAVPNDPEDLYTVRKSKFPSGV